MASSGSNSKIIESYILKLASDDPEIVKTSLNKIREKIHTSKQFYKDFLVQFHSSDGVSKLLDIFKNRIDKESVIDLAASVLATCCLDKNNAGQMKELNGIPVLATILRQYSKSSVSIVNRCARTLANLAKSVDIEEELDEDLIPILVQALDDTEDIGCCHSLLRVLKMFASCKNKKIVWNIIDCGGLRIVCSKLKTKDSKLVLLAVETIVSLTTPFDKRKSKCRITLPVAAANPVLENDSLSNLFDLLSHNKSEVQYHSWECIGNLMSSDVGRAALGNAGFVKFYLATARNEDVKMSVRERCAQYLCLCCQESVNRAKMSELDGLQFLIDLLREDSGSLPVLPSALVVAAIAEFRYDKFAMERFANLKLVKALILCLEKKAKQQTEQQEERSEEKTILEAGEDENALHGSRKRKRKKRRERSKKIRRNSVEESEEVVAPTLEVDECHTPTLVSERLSRDADDGLSPKYQAHWYPESPRLSPGSSSGIHIASPPQHYPAGLSPPRAPYHGSASPPHPDQPIYQFPSSMMSPPKSDTTSPGSSPTYFYDPSSPQKFYSYTEDIFSPVVSDASESETSSGSTSDTDNSTNSSEWEMKDDTSKGAMQMPVGCNPPSNKSLLEHATRKLSLSRVGGEHSKDGAVTLEGHPSISTKASQDASNTENVSAASEVISKGDVHSTGKSSVFSEQMASTSIMSSPPGPRTARVSSVPRTSFESEPDCQNRDRTPSKEDGSKSRRKRGEEENIIRILNEIIQLHQIPAVLYITSSHAIQTLLNHATKGTKAQDRAHLLLKYILTSNFYFDKLVGRNIPYIIYRCLSFREKQYEKTMTTRDREKRKEMRSTHSFCSTECSNGLECSKLLEYLDLLREVAETSFGQKEVEHVLMSQHHEHKFCAAVSVPYLFSAGPFLRHLLIDCEALCILLSSSEDWPSTKTVSQVSRSLSRASRLLLRHWGAYCDKYFVLDSSAGDEASLGVTPDAGLESIDSQSEECFFKAQEHLSDVKLICSGGKTVKASRQVLAARSEYFACLLTGSFQEAEQDSIHLGDKRASSLIGVLHGLYDCHPYRCSTLHSLHKEKLDNLLDLIATLRFYLTAKDKPASSGVECCPLERKVTSDILNRKLCSINVGKLANFAALHNCQKFLDCCLLFVLRERSHIRKHLRELLTSQHRDLICNCVIDLFRNSTLI